MPNTHVYIQNIHKIFIQFILIITIFEENDQIYMDEIYIHTYMEYNEYWQYYIKIL